MTSCCSMCLARTMLAASFGGCVIVAEGGQALNMCEKCVEHAERRIPRQR